jgi:1-acyl-sn-glycerol-3-phosphate acyltransferase
VTARLSTAALVATAAWDLWRYQAWARVRGPAPERAVGILQRWSRRAWRLLRLDVRVEGRPSVAPCVYVANHRSYLDIPLLGGVLGTSFMSRADIASWPIVGAAARVTGAIFVDRDDLHGRIRAARALARRLRGGSLVVFPEGTTTGARLPGAFNPGLFRLLHRLRAPVVPVTIRYAHPRAYWTDDVALRLHLLTRVFGPSRLTAAVHIGEPLEPGAHADGAGFARAAYAAVCRPIEELGELA